MTDNNNIGQDNDQKKVDIQDEIRQIDRQIGTLIERRKKLTEPLHRKKSSLIEDNNTTEKVAKLKEKLKKRGEETICLVIPKNKEKNYDDFNSMINKSGAYADFEIYPVPDPVHRFRSYFIEYIKEHGLSSLLNYTIYMDSILSRSMEIDDTKDIIFAHLSKLDGAERLIIIDPYLYGKPNKSNKINVAELFSELISKTSKNLKELFIITNGKCESERDSIISCLDKKIIINEIPNEGFHDRFWIDPDANKGVVMGTSLNGIGNKIALIDYLRKEDVAEIVRLVNIQKLGKMG
jgi:hypothetical protein